MPTVQIECPQCAWEAEVDDTLVGRRLKCSKCGASFVAEAGGDYGLIEPPRPPRVQAVEEAPAPASGRPSRSKPAPEPKKPDPKLERLMEQWAEEE